MGLTGRGGGISHRIQQAKQQRVQTLGQSKANVSKISKLIAPHDPDDEVVLVPVSEHQRKKKKNRRLRGIAEEREFEGLLEALVAIQGDPDEFEKRRQLLLKSADHPLHVRFGEVRTKAIPCMNPDKPYRFFLKKCPYTGKIIDNIVSLYEVDDFDTRERPSDPQARAIFEETWKKPEHASKFLAYIYHMQDSTKELREWLDRNKDTEEVQQIAHSMRDDLTLQKLGQLPGYAPDGTRLAEKLTNTPSSPLGRYKPSILRVHVEALMEEANANPEWTGARFSHDHVWLDYLESTLW
jgi:hypothetical protein